MVNTAAVRTDKVCQASVQLALAALTTFRHKCQRERVKAASSLLMVLFLQLSLSKAGVNVELCNDYEEPHLLRVPGLTNMIILGSAAQSVRNILDPLIRDQPWLPCAQCQER